jgi:hypothetical protein
VCGFGVLCLIYSILNFGMFRVVVVVVVVVLLFLRLKYHVLHITTTACERWCFCAPSFYQLDQ